MLRVVGCADGVISYPARPPAERDTTVTLTLERDCSVTFGTKNSADGAPGAFPELRPDGLLVRLAEPGQRQRVDDLHPLG